MFNNCLAFVALTLLINYPLLIIGIILIGWGVREYKLNKQLNVKSKLIPVLIVIGCVMSISSCSLAIIGAEEQEEAKHQQQLKKQVELKRQQELEKQAAAERSEPTVEREHFRNCKEMNAVYPSGVPEDHLHTLAHVTVIKMVGHVSVNVTTYF